MLMRMLRCLIALGLLVGLVGCGQAGELLGPAPAPDIAGSGRPEDAAIPGAFELERPTLICLGAWWLVKGDANRNTKIRFEYRAAGATSTENADSWRHGPDFFRVDSAGISKEIDKGWAPPPDATLYAGSIFELRPDTEYELRFTLIDPDGGGAVKTLKQRTRPTPQAWAEGRRLYVTPGNGGGSGSAADPFKGLAAAQAQAQPGDVFLLGKGVYKGTFTIAKNGEPGKPIVWRGAGAPGEAILDGLQPDGKRPGRTISATDCHDIFFENLDIVNADFAVVCHRSQRIVMRGCRLYRCSSGFTATVNPDNDVMRDFYIADNHFESDCKWPRTKGIEEDEGVQVGGEGHVVCYNTFKGHADAISTYQHTHSCAIDFYGNDIDIQTDDGIEMDYSLRNTRCFRNRLTNCFQGISVQPVYGGPVYVFRNAMLNVEVEPFKIHNSPSGVLLYHNTVVKAGAPMIVMTTAPMNNIVSRNNLFLGTKSAYGFEMHIPAVRCDFDYDGIDGQFENYLKWNGERYTEMNARVPAEAHAVRVRAEGCFDSKLLPPEDPKKIAEPKANDLRLAADSSAIDKAVPLTWFNDGHAGAAPDLGAYEFGRPLPPYGIRPAGAQYEQWPIADATGPGTGDAPTSSTTGAAAAPHAPAAHPERDQTVQAVRRQACARLQARIGAMPDQPAIIAIDGKAQPVQLVGVDLEKGLQIKLFGGARTLAWADLSSATLGGLLETLADADADDGAAVYASIALLYTIDRQDMAAAGAMEKALQLNPDGAAELKATLAKLR